MVDDRINPAAPRARRSDLPVRLASALLMLAVTIAALVIGGRVFDAFVVLVALVSPIRSAREAVRADELLDRALGAVGADGLEHVVHLGRTGADMAAVGKVVGVIGGGSPAGHDRQPSSAVAEGC